jgi:hypothetical protein
MCAFRAAYRRHTANTGAVVLILTERQDSVSLCVSRYSGTVRGSNPVGARFSAPVQTGPGVHASSYTVGKGSFLGAKLPGRGVDHSLPSSAEVKERVGLCLLPLWAFVASSRVNFTFTFTLLLKHTHTHTPQHTTHAHTHTHHTHTHTHHTCFGSFNRSISTLCCPQSVRSYKRTHAAH